MKRCFYLSGIRCLKFNTTPSIYEWKSCRFYRRIFDGKEAGESLKDVLNKLNKKQVEDNNMKLTLEENVRKRKDILFNNMNSNDCVTPDMLDNAIAVINAQNKYILELEKSEDLKICNKERIEQRLNQIKGDLDDRLNTMIEFEFSLSEDDMTELKEYIEGKIQDIEDIINGRWK